MKAMILLLLLLVLVVGCEQKSNKPLTEAQLAALDEAKQPNVALLGAPPMIPEDHPFDITEDISSFENGGQACLDCHDNKDEEDAPQTKHPERHNCLQCHIPITDETATDQDFSVENTFEKYVPTR